MQKGQTKCLSTLFFVRGFAGNIHVAIFVKPYQQNV